MESVIVNEFTQRNGAVNDARDAGQDVRQAMRGHKRIVMIINDMTAFMQAVYSRSYDMSGFVELSFEKGREHKIQLFAAVTPDDFADCARFAAMRVWAGWARGVHLGGMFDQQGILRLEMAASDSVRQLPAGVGYADDGSGRALKIITPLLAG
jgi:S-DNA-T family DNA segregation ATPase FtsK/SpoIIIE